MRQVGPLGERGFTGKGHVGVDAGSPDATALTHRRAQQAARPAPQLASRKMEQDMAELAGRLDLDEFERCEFGDRTAHAHSAVVEPRGQRGCGVVFEARIESSAKALTWLSLVAT